VPYAQYDYSVFHDDRQAIRHLDKPIGQSTSSGWCQSTSNGWVEGRDIGYDRLQNGDRVIRPNDPKTNRRLAAEAAAWPIPRTTASA
jgi:hypothetical protein